MKHLERAFDKQSQAWKYIITLFVSFFGGSILGSLPLMVIVMMHTVKNGVNIAPDNVYNFSQYGISSNFGFFLMLLPFVFSLAILIFFIKVFHKRSLSEVINGRKRIRWSRFVSGAIFWTVLMVLSLGASYILDPDNFVFRFEFSSFIPLLILTLLLIPIQTSYEEIAFRGYFAQGIAASTRNRWLVLIIPSTVFGLLHVANPEVQEHGFLVMMPQYIFFGMIFALISILDDGIELAMGVHAANNAFISLFVTNSSSAFQTSAVFEQLVVNPYWGFVELAVGGFLLVAFFYKKYNWDFSILNRKVEIPQDDTNSSTP